jgi:hypothetical protein
MSTTENTPADDGRAPAVVRAEQATDAWDDVARLQKWASPNHADFYALAGELVGTLHAVEDLTCVLAGQVAGYGTGRTLYDDTHAVDPAARLAEARTQLDAALGAISTASSRLNECWSTIGHVGVEVPT